MVPDSNFSADAFDRRRRTQSRLELEEIFYHPGLALLPGEEAVRLPGAEAIALRALALVLIGCEATGLSGATVDALIDEYRPPFSAAEWTWFESPARDPDSTRNFGWRFESAAPLLWAAGLVGAPRRADAQTEPFALIEPLVHFRRDELLARAEGLSAAEILDSADLNFCYQCAALLALDEGREPPTGLDAGVLIERHRAFTWLLEGGGDWDEVVARA